MWTYKQRLGGKGWEENAGNVFLKQDSLALEL